jgi:hypothetical protein
MSTTFKYNWGQKIRVIATAPVNMRPQQTGWICGMRKFEGSCLYLVEFSDGQAFELLDIFIEPANEN